MLFRLNRVFLGVLNKVSMEVVGCQRDKQGAYQEDQSIVEATDLLDQLQEIETGAFHHLLFDVQS